MNTRVWRQLAALLEVLAVYMGGALLNDWLDAVLIRNHIISSQSPFVLLTLHASNSDLLLASRQLFLALLIIYFSFFVIIIPLDWLRGRRGPATYGLTRAGRTTRALVIAGVVTAALAEWPVLIHTLVDAIHPLGPMAPWRQAYFSMSWMRWQFWLFSAILSFAVIPVVEELLFRGYYQRRLAEAWGDGPAIVAVACLFTLSHKQYLIANAYNVTMVLSLFCIAVGFGVVFAWTRSLIPSMIAHAIINVPMTPLWQAVLLGVFIIVIFLGWRGGIAAVKQVFHAANLAPLLLLSLLLGGYALFSGRISDQLCWAIGMLAVSIAIGFLLRPRDPAQIIEG